MIRLNILRVVALVMALAILSTVTGFASEIGLLKHKDVDGADYIEKTSITPVLLIGIDGMTKETDHGSTDGGQVGFLRLIVIDHHDKTVCQLQIDRDTMMPVETKNEIGQADGSREMQICLAYAIGGGSDAGCESLIRALNDYFDIEIPLYWSVDLDRIGKINRALGGVEVTLPADYADYDPEMYKGAEIVLDDQQAEFMMCGRNFGDSTNAERIQRQEVYLEAAFRQLKEKIKENVAFLDQALDSIEDSVCTNVTGGRLINEMSRAVSYDFQPVDTILGEYSIGADGSAEFHADAQSTDAWVTNVFYRPNT